MALLGSVVAMNLEVSDGPRGLSEVSDASLGLSGGHVC